MSRLIRSACLTNFVEVARLFGLDPYGLLKQAGLDRACLLDPDIKIPADVCGRLLETSAREARIEDFGLRMAEMRRFSNLGPLALAMRDAANLREALQLGIRYLPLHTDVLLVSLEEKDGLATIKIDFIGSQLARVRQIAELAVGVTHRAMHQLLGIARQSWQVRFSHGAPANGATHLRVFGSRVEFGRDFNGVLCPARVLDLPLPGADPVMSRHMKHYLDSLLMRAGATVGDKARQLVYESLSSGRCSAAQVASNLGMDRRTLYRHLARNRETFSSIVDSVRIDLARRYVKDHGRPLGEVAFLLGFSDSSAFSRWFRGKFARSPLAWRAMD